MKKIYDFFAGIPMKIRQYWKKRFRSKTERMSRGSQHIDKTISWARNENWRRKEKKK